MWVALQGNLHQAEAVSHEPSLKLKGIEDENKSILIQIQNELKEIKMAMKLIETTVYDALKLLVALTVVICISIVIMSMK